MKALGLLLAVALMLPLPQAVAESVNPDSGYIVGNVFFHNDFPVTSLSMMAVGGGNTVQKTTNNSSAGQLNYQLPVPGGDYSYSVSSSCGLSGGGNSALTVFFNQRNLPVASGASVPNNYVFDNVGFIRFRVNITADTPISSAAVGSWATKNVAAGEKTATYSSGTPSTSATSYEWVLPVVPNQQVELTANINVSDDSGTKTYTFSKSAPAPYMLIPVDVLPGAEVLVPLEINFVEGVQPPSSNNQGTLEGTVELLGLPSYNFSRHVFRSTNRYANPASYSFAYSFPGNQYTTPKLYTPTTNFDTSVDSSLRWPYINGDPLSDKATIYPGTTTYFNQQRAGGFLSGSINLSGTVPNEDLLSLTFNIAGVGNNFYGLAPIVRHATSSAYKKPWDRDYLLFLTSGDWELFDVTLTKRLLSPTRTYSVTFVDYRNRFDGSTDSAPISIQSGMNEKDFNYCLGSAVMRFRDAQGRLVRNPSISGKGTHKTNGVIDLTANVSSSYSSSEYVEMAEIEVFGPPGDYNLSTIQVYTNDGKLVKFAPRSISLTCSTTKTYDFPGPVVTIESPQAEQITNLQPFPVSGRVAGGSSAIAGVTVNGEPTALTPLMANEAAFNYDLVLTGGENAITLVATETSGAQATEVVPVYADYWQPTVSIRYPSDGDSFVSTETSIPLTVEAADLGYGYTLSVLVDDMLVHTATGGGDIVSPVALSFEDMLRGLGVGEHVITATVTDRAGNRASSTVTIALNEAPPVLAGLTDQVIEATSAAGAAASFEVSATSTCNGEAAPVLFAEPVLTPQGNATTTAGAVNRTFQWQAVVAPDGHSAQYLVQVSDALDFSVVKYSSAWQNGTTWSQSLPVGTWFWRVIARDSVHTAVQSNPAAGNSFSILNADNSVIGRFSIAHHTEATYSGGVYPEPGNLMWVGPFVHGDYEVDVDRWFLSFDTSALGAGTTVTAARLNLDYQDRSRMEYGSVTNVHGSTWVPPGDETTFSNVGALLASQSIAFTRPLGMVTFTVRPDYVEETGLTKFALVAANDLSGEIMNASPGYAKETSYLELTYIPSTAPWAAAILTPQENVASGDQLVFKIFRWSTMTAADGDPAEYLVEVSSVADFTSITFSSNWQTETAWAQALPPGTWYWRVTARDAMHHNVQSNRAASSFIVTYLPPPPPPAEATVICSANSGDTFPLGATVVTCTATDACNRSASGSFTITVQDTTPPVLVLPADLTVEATSAQGATVEFVATATDTVDPAPAVTCTPAFGSTLAVGASIVGCTASDASGNQASGTFWVTVEETAPPLLTVPADVTAEATGSLTPVEIGQATATHDLAVNIVSDAPATFPVGMTMVTWTATAANGKSASGTQNVTVVDNTAPAVTAPANLTVEATGSLTQVDIGMATASDAVGVASVVSNAPEVYPLGITTIIWTATDAAGNLSTAVQTVTVIDTTAPVLAVPADILVLLNTPLGAQVVLDFLHGAMATDAVDGPVPVVTSGVPENLNSVGVKVVTFTATDSSGNQAIGTAAIRVVYGGGEEFMEPVSLLKPFKQGSTVPVKIGFTDASGASVAAAVVKISVYLVDKNLPVGEPIEVEATGGADTGSLFKFVDDHYQYNLSTKKLSVGSYQVRAVLDDGTSRSVLLALK